MFHHQDTEMQPIFIEEAMGSNAVKISHFNLKFHVLIAQTVGPNWNSMGPAEGDYRHHIHFACEGSAALTYGETILELKPGNAYWIPGNFPVGRQCDDYYRHYALIMNCELASGVDLFSTWPQRRPLHLGPWHEKDWIDDWKERPYSLNTQMRLQGQMYQWIAEYFDDLDAMIAMQSQKYVRYARIFDLIENSLGGDLQVGEMAKLYGTSLRAFSLAFTRDLGLSPKSYLNHRLNQYACRLLVTEDWPIRTISQHLRFSDEHYFNRFFSKMNGLPPYKYRQLFLSVERGGGDKSG
ncbi:AraC family transcriptional regulator [bacterium]|nr:MAG: AraC family transcriptional regulator [bacterium]